MKNIATALVKAQRSFGPALKDKTNPAFRSKYADLGACIESVIGALNDNGIALLQRALECDNGITVETVFLHESGESWCSGPLHVPASKQDPQGYGSALTYARRYSLMSACGHAPEDDDGNAASKPRQAEKPPVKTEKPAVDMSPKARAERIKSGVASGLAAGAAAALSREPEEVLNAVWALLDPTTQEKLQAAWPKAEA